MHKIETLRSLEKVKLLSDDRRLRIMRILMAGPATLTQLSERLGRSAAWVRHHVKALEAAGLVLPGDVRTTGRVTEKYYRAAAHGLMLESLILPKSRTPVLVFAGSHDMALQTAGDRLSRHRSFLALHVGSLNGLMRLRQGVCQVTGVHLLGDDGGYNVDFVHHVFPEGGVELYTLAFRMQGLMLARGNPKHIHDVKDLARAGVRLVQRNSGSGTRLWLQHQMALEGMAASQLHPGTKDISTHTEAAALVRQGRADVAIGLEAAAADAGLDFVPLFEERYDLVVVHSGHREVDPLLDYIQSADFRSHIGSLPGYSATHTGEQVPLH
jgi:molybdate-binding protein/DNA-binding HxlR family transcriptional regulator